MITVCETRELYAGNYNFPLFTVFQDRETVTSDMLLNSIILNKILSKLKTDQN